MSPNNPTGSFLSARDIDVLTSICRAPRLGADRRRGLCRLPDRCRRPITDIAARAGVLAFTLGGASKSIGLPQVKLGWTLVGGPAPQREAALAALEVIADTFLSVSTPVQVAAPRLLRDGAAVRDRDSSACSHESCRRADASWPQLPGLRSVAGRRRLVGDRPRSGRPERRADRAGSARAGARILVHPGFFFDMPHEAFLVVSLLPDSDVFADAFARMLRSRNLMMATPSRRRNRSVTLLNRRVLCLHSWRCAGVPGCDETNVDQGRL